jgi:hypothetical protein
MYLCFRAPDGTEFLGDAALPEAESRLRSAGASYWSTGSGDAALWAENPFNPVQLQFYFDGESRFQLRYIEPNRMPLLTRAGQGEGDPVSILVGGNPMELAGGTLVSRQAAISAARHFAATRESDPALDWA